MFDHDQAERLPVQECMRLLGETPIGRVAFTDQTLPAVAPMNFAVDGDCVIVRTRGSSKFLAAVHESVVAFQADQIDVDHGRGWSVTGVGHAEVVTDADDIARFSSLSLHAWGSDSTSRFVRIRLEAVWGRRVGVASG
jgi:nitroimidazol reductase NimA-like FMN-containing flavoprotein (pyridoxamine 5'-phosphate oxidase superfamily)